MALSPLRRYDLVEGGLGYATSAVASAELPRLQLLTLWAVGGRLLQGDNSIAGDHAAGVGDPRLTPA
jgi:hypothetical protein